MILSDTSIRYMSKMIEPFNPDNVQPGSYDLTLGDIFLLYNDKNSYDLKTGKPEYLEIQTDVIDLAPGEFLLGTTQERIKLPSDITAFVHGRSSVGRTGLFVHNAGLVDAGFEGQITLEFFNASCKPIRLTKGLRIAQITFHRMDTNAHEPYHGKYQGQSGTTGSRMYEDA